MKRIGLLSDTHTSLDDFFVKAFATCDEIWHAGDFGTDDFLNHFMELFQNKTVRGVYGNIDGKLAHELFEEKLFFTVENFSVYMKHIGGYPGKYAKGVKEDIIKSHSNLFISGHSHIVKVMNDDALNCLHINPGAAGKEGWHKKRTALRFEIANTKIKNMELLEIDKY